MHPDQPQGPQPTIERQAATWFALLCDPQCSDEQRRACQHWQQQDPRHAAAYARLQSLWEASARLPSPVSGRPLQRRRLLGWASAACVLAASSALLWQRQRGDLSTGVGETRVLTLADGSRLELAGDSAVRLDIGDTRRHVELLQGEAYLQASTASQPLRVSARNGLCSLNGSNASLCMEGDAVSVTVSDGLALIQLAGKNSQLSAGQRLTYRDNDLGAVTRVDPAQVLAWREGRLVFFDTPLEIVIEHLQRWQPGLVLISDRQLARRPVSLILDLERREHALGMLAANLPIRLRSLGPITLIQPLG